MGLRLNGAARAYPFQWDITGLAIDSPLNGTQLTQVPAHSAFWFAWVTFWPETTVYLP